MVSSECIVAGICTSVGLGLGVGVGLGLGLGLGVGVGLGLGLGLGLGRRGRHRRALAEDTRVTGEADGRSVAVDRFEGEVGVPLLESSTYT